MYSVTFTYSCRLPILKSLQVLLVFSPPIFCISAHLPSSLRCLPLFSLTHSTQPFLIFSLLQHFILHVSIHTTTSKLITPATARATATTASTATVTATSTATITTIIIATTATSAAATIVATTTTTLAATTPGTTNYSTLLCE